MRDASEHASEQQARSIGTSAESPARSIRRKLWAELVKNIVFALAALFVIVLGSIAWFASSFKVSSGGATVSFQFDPVKLATKGERQEAERDLLKLDDGTPYPPDGEPAETYYVTEDKEIALRLSEEEVKVSPGTSGELSFYIIPSKDGAQKVTLHLGLAGYEETKDENGNATGSKINDLVLNSLLSGHILLFENCVNGSYTDWLRPSSVTAGGADYQITVKNSNAEAGVPWKVTIYWVWPLRYENMKDDYNGLLNAFIEAQATNLTGIEGTSYRYSQIFLTKDSTLTTEDSRSDAYNQADEYIGRKADYLYVTIKTDLVN